MFLNDDYVPERTLLQLRIRSVLLYMIHVTVKHAEWDGYKRIITFNKTNTFQHTSRTPPKCNVTKCLQTLVVSRITSGNTDTKHVQVKSIMIYLRRVPRVFRMFAFIISGPCIWAQPLPLTIFLFASTLRLGKSNLYVVMYLWITIRFFFY